MFCLWRQTYTERRRGEFWKRCSRSRIMGIMRPLSHIRYFKAYSASLLASLLHNQLSNGQWCGVHPGNFLVCCDIEYRSIHNSFGECYMNNPLPTPPMCKSPFLWCSRQNWSLPQVAYFPWVMRLWKEDIKRVNRSRGIFLSQLAM